ncbi:hypothetical protein MBFIL_09050 [Methanobrevibacter filiformis]|uniref:Uncharacterized protein n=2 Tax=Methanobrevibacter filiformis TaxID=55758 RepID=A0A166C889_9EURY|nr:hypothetical protein MBFIL_09050 [Methanobrevibacter filiformis]
MRDKKGDRVGGPAESGELYVISKNKAEILGNLVADELFTTIGGERWYCVSIHDISIKNVPFAVGLMKHRSYDNNCEII